MFNVDLDGQRVLNNFDIVAAAGNDTGTMRSFDITSDGNVDIDLGHVVENPLINGIEIRAHRPGSDAGRGLDLVRRSYRRRRGRQPMSPYRWVGSNWNTVRGAFMLNGNLYTAWADGTFTRQTFNGTSYGPAVPVDTADQIIVLGDWHARRGAGDRDVLRLRPDLLHPRGSSQLFYRYFTPESDVVGAKRFVASDNVAGIDFSKVHGMFTTGNKVYWATPTGALNAMDWAQDPLSGFPVPVPPPRSPDPAMDTVTWTARALFLFQDANGAGVGQPPTAAFDSSLHQPHLCLRRLGVDDLGGTISSYAWNFGDGSTGTGDQAVAHVRRRRHLPGDPDDHHQPERGRLGHEDDVTVQRQNQAPQAAFSQSCTGTVCAFDAGASADPDGTIASYAWNFGDGDTATGVSPTHDYGTEGPRTVKLTVTDNEQRDRDGEQAGQRDHARRCRWSTPTAPTATGPATR